MIVLPVARGRDCGDRHDGDCEARLQWVEPPAVDQQDHEQKQRRHEPARDEQQRCVRGHVRSFDRLGNGRGSHAAQRDESDENDRRLDEEDRLPAEQLSQDAADGRPKRGADDSGKRPDPRSARIRSGGLAEEVERGTHHGRPRNALDRATRDEHTERGREAARERGSNEHDDPESEDVRGPAAREESGRQRRESEREVEGGENPGERRDLDVVASEDVRQRDRDDRGVGQDDADRDGKQHDWDAHFSDELSVQCVGEWNNRSMSERVLCPTLIGRQDQLFVLEDALLTAHRGESRFVALGGEAGMGKTRLATELAARAQRLDWEVLWGACSEAEFSLPYLPLVEAVGNYLSRQDTDRLADQLGAARRELAQLFPLLGRDEPDAPVGDPTQAKLRLFEAVVGLLSLPARERGLLLIVEDVHWADAATRELLDHIARRLTNTRSLVLVTYRSDELDRRHPLAPLLQTWRRSRVAELVTLSPLGETEIAEMIAAILDHDEIGPEFRDLMHARTEGNPFVLEEMLREAIDRGDVFRTADGWDRRALTEVRIPETVRDTILLRFARLDPAEAEVLQAAAVLGRTFEYATLLAVADLPDATVQSALAIGVAQQMIEEVGSGQATYRWRHALTQEAIADEIVLPRRQEIHGRAADVLSAAGASALQVARHLLGAARFDEAVPACLDAAQEAEASFAFAEALEVLERALPHVHDPVERSRLLCRMGRVLWTDGKTAAAETVLAEGIPGLVAANEVEAAGYRLILARAQWEQSKPDAAREEFEEARRVLEQAGPSPELALAYMRLSGLYKFEFAADRSLETAEKAVEVAKAAGADFERIWAQSWMAYSLLDVGRTAEGIELLDESFDEARSRGYSFIAHNIAYNDAWTRLHTMTPGIDDRIVEIASEPGPEVITNMLEIARSWGLRARGDLVGALETIERVEPTSAATISEKVRWRRRLELAEVLLELGRLGDAAALIPPLSERAELQDVVYDAAAQIRLRLATERAWRGDRDRPRDRTERGRLCAVLGCGRGRCRGIRRRRTARRG